VLVGGHNLSKCAMEALPMHRTSPSRSPPIFSSVACCMLGNSIFQVVSGDEGGTIVLWNLADGRRAGGFSLHAAPASAAGGATHGGGATSPSAAGKSGGEHGGERLTAMAFDAAQRRLLTATDAGGLRAYNFNSG